MTGQTISHYRITEQLGEVGTGTPGSAGLGGCFAQTCGRLVSFGTTHPQASYLRAIEHSRSEPRAEARGPKP